MKSRTKFLAGAVCVVSLSLFNGFAQSVHVSVHASAADWHHRPWASNIVVPQSRVYSRDARNAVTVTRIDVGVVITEQAAETTMDISVHNPTGSRLEAELVVPVPENAVVKGFTFQGAAAEPTAALLPKDEARKTYDSIVAKIKDPALLEFIGCSLVRSSVFPVDPRGDQKVRLTYEHLLAADGNRVDYMLPRSESLENNIPWRISVKIKSKKRIATVYSPSHKLETKQPTDYTASARITEDARLEPGPFRLAYLIEQDAMSASLFAYPGKRSDEGYFLLLAGTPQVRESDARKTIKREVILVLDRSGSMNGEKLDQAREAALQVIAGLDDGEFFNIIVYNESVESFAPAPVVKTDQSAASARQYLKRLTARGGTNIHDALLETLRQKPGPDTIPLVLFLTDGLPTIGQTSEVAIREIAIKANPHNRRIFTFGVGMDVNAPLLEKIASETRARPTFVLPKEDIEVKVASMFNRLAGPVLADPELVLLDRNGKPAWGRVMDMIPNRLPDLFNGDQLVLLGRYSGEEELTFQVSGNYLGKKRTFKFTFSFDKSTVQHSFVPRLWASRQIAVLVDAVRQAGADTSTPSSVLAAARDPKTKELVDEIVRLSTEFGVLTEYTAFLAREGTDLTKRDTVMQEANRNFQNRAIATRSGWGGANQSYNIDGQRNQTTVNSRNYFVDEKWNSVATTSVQQIGDRAFYQRNGTWVDSRVVTNADRAPDRVVEIGSAEFRRLAERLAEQGRQGSIALRGSILLEVDGKTVLCK